MPSVLVRFEAELRLVDDEVTAAGLWVEVSGGEHYEYVCDGDTYRVRIVEPGYFIPDYLAYNPTRASVMEKREELSQKRAEAGRKGAMKRWSRTDRHHGNTDGKSNGKTMANGMATGWQPDSPLPLPLENSPKAVTELGDVPAGDSGERPGIENEQTPELPVLPTLTLREIA